MTPADLAEQIARPQRVALAGRHGAGKTTLLAMLYREAVAGHFAGVRLSAADSRTASYLAGLVHLLEQGEALPPSAVSRELRFRLQRGDTVAEIAFLDAPGDSPLPECDAVWLCLEAPQGADPPELPPPGLPLAIVLTKADMLSSLEASAMRACLEPFARVGHVLGPPPADRGTFAVSALGPCGMSLDGKQTLIPSPLQPAGLETPLAWLADVLARQARSRLERLYEARGPGRARALEAFRAGYPGDPLGQRLRPPASGRSLLVGAAAIAVLLAGAVAWPWWPRTTEPEEEKRAEGDPPPAKAADGKAERRKRGEAALAAFDASKDDLEARLARSGRLADDYAGTPAGAEFRKRQAALAAKLEARDWAEARRPGPVDRRAKAYSLYLARHPKGAHAVEARGELAGLMDAWERDLYGRLREAWRTAPGDAKKLRPLAQEYLASHPRGKRRAQAAEVLAWLDRIARPGEYAVTLVSGIFDKKAAFMISRGVSLSVTLEVAGETYGPSTIIKNSYFPEWNFAFPRKVRWKSGDSVRVIVTDNFFWKRKVADETFDGPAALAKLDDSCDVGKGTLNFHTDLKPPRLPKGD